MEAVGSSEHREGGEIAAEAPSTNGDLREIGIRTQRGELVEYRELIRKHGCGEVTGHRAFPIGSEARRSRTIGDHDDESLVGEPLRCAVRTRCGYYALCVRPAVWIEEDGKLATVPIFWGDDCGRDPSRTDPMKQIGRAHV